jgi:hypothetical protein
VAFLSIFLGMCVSGPCDERTGVTTAACCVLSIVAVSTQNFVSSLCVGRSTDNSGVFCVPDGHGSTVPAHPDHQRFLSSVTSTCDIQQHETPFLSTTALHQTHLCVCLRVCVLV